MIETIKENNPGEEVVSKIEAKDIVPQGNQIDNWIEMRKNFSQKVVSIMVEGKDFHKLNFRGKEVQVLAKGGAEKVASALGWVAEFVKDSETYEMLGSPAGTLCYTCNLRNGEFKGQGRGARSIKQDAGDINKTIKMAQKSAFIDAVLRASGLSDLFTQDLVEEEERPSLGQNFASGDVSPYAPKTQATFKQKMFISKLSTEKGISLNQMKELQISYNTPQKMIDYLTSLPAKGELPVIEQN